MRSDIEAFERAMGAVAMAEKHTQGSALAHLESLPLSSETVRAVRDLCAEAFAAVGRSDAMLEQAKRRTEAAEAALSEPGQTDAHKAQNAASLGAQAASSLASLEQAISLAQSRIDECDRRRALLRARLSHR
jgi:hypothetical protein